MNQCAAQPVQVDVAPLGQHHVDQVIRIENEIYPFPWTAGNFRDSLQAGYDAWILSPQQDGARSTAEPPILGYAVVMQVLDEAHLLNLGIARPFQGAGYGGRFLRWLMRWARLAGASGMFLEVRPSNETAIGLYQRNGFVEVGKRPGYYPSFDGLREDAKVMRRDLRDLGEPGAVGCGAL